MSETNDGTSIDEQALRAYLRAALAVQGLALAPDAVARVEEQFLRLAHQGIAEGDCFNAIP